MAVITLSWQLGCLGDHVADEIANQLCYKVFGKQEIDDLVAKQNAEISKGMGADNSEQAAGEKIQLKAFEQLRRNHTTYVHLLISQIYEIASQDKTIIKGHGAQTVLTGQPHILRVRMTGSLDYRVTKIQEQRKLDKTVARELVTRDDRERMGLVRYLFQRESVNMNWYDMIVDVEKFDVKTFADMIAGVARAWDDRFPMTEDERQGLGALALENRIRVILYKEMPYLIGAEIIVRAGGIVTLRGDVALQKEKEAVERRVRSVPKVQDVVNNVTVKSTLGMAFS